MYSRPTKRKRLRWSGRWHERRHDQPIPRVHGQQVRRTEAALLQGSREQVGTHLLPTAARENHPRLLGSQLQRRQVMHLRCDGKITCLQIYCREYRRKNFEKQVDT